MPFVLISTQIRLENGPTYCGDEHSDPELMAFLGAELKVEAGNTFKVFVCESPPRIVLNMLATRGYRVVGVAGIGQTCSWTLFTEKELSA